MNGFNGDTALEDIDDELASEDDDEIDDEPEAAEFWPGFPLPPGLVGGQTRRGQGRRAYYRSPATQGLVTQVQLQNLSRRIQSDIKSVSGRVTTLQATTTRLASAVAKQNKVNAQQAKQIAAVRTEMKKAREMSLIMFMLTRPKSTAPTTTAGTFQGANVPVGSRILYETGDDNAILPLFLFMDDMNPMLMMMMATGGTF